MKIDYCKLPRNIWVEKDIGYFMEVRIRLLWSAMGKNEATFKARRGHFGYCKNQHKHVIY